MTDCVLSDKLVKARKDYNCDATTYLHELGDHDIFTPEEMEIINNTNGEIKKGNIYREVVGKFEGELFTFRAIPEIDDICLNYDLYPEY